MKKSHALCLAVVLGVLSTPLAAQDDQLDQIRENIDIFSGVLTQSLGLGEGGGLFGLSRGGIEASYLRGQGAVFEVRTPLAARRNRVGLASLSNAMQSLAGSGNPFAVARRSVANEDMATSTLSAADSSSGNYYAQMMDNISSVDYSLAVRSALQQANEAARSLFSLGNIDEQSLAAIRSELAELGDAAEEKFQELRQMRAELQGESGAASAATTASGSTLQNRLAELSAEIEPLRERALAEAAELKAKNEQAALEYAENWRKEVAQFEDHVFSVMCDYGATLRALPADENITVILSGLGEERGDNSLPDKIHVFTKADVSQCQSGAIDVAELRARTTSYSY